MRIKNACTSETWNYHRGVLLVLCAKMANIFAAMAGKAVASQNCQPSLSGKQAEGTILPLTGRAESQCEKGVPD